MSHIFDALQRAESESTGAKRPAFSLATELLQAAEQKMRTAGANGETSAIAIGDLPTGANGEPPAPADSFAATPSTSFEDLERCPVLTVSTPEESHLVAVDKEESLGAEKFRFLAVRLRQLRQSRPLKKVLITSTIPQEGKSTVATNLACTLARRKQHRTLLLEGDLRRNREHERVPDRDPRAVGLTGRECTRKSPGVDAIGKACTADGAVDRVVRLDHHRFSPRTAAGRHQHLGPVGGWNLAGHAQWHDRTATPAPWFGSARKVETAGSAGEQQHKRGA